MTLWQRLDGPHARPFTVLVACTLLLAAVDGGQGRFLSAATAYSTLQIFATISLVTLGLGLTMMIREFDLSVVGMYGMAGCIAVLMGTQHPWLGLWFALAIGVAAGFVQGFIIVRLNLSSVGLTLGGLLVFVGIAFVLTESRSLPYENLGVALVLNERIESIFSIRSIVAICFFVGAAAIFAWTRLGRDIIAIGSDRRAAMTADVKVDPLVISIFAFSGLCASLSGVLLSYSLASASPAGLSDVATPDRGLPSSDRALEIMSPYQNHANWIKVAVSGYPPGKARNRCPTNSRSEISLPSIRQSVGLCPMVFSKSPSGFPVTASLNIASRTPTNRMSGSRTKASLSRLRELLMIRAFWQSAGTSRRPGDIGK